MKMLDILNQELSKNGLKNKFMNKEILIKIINYGIQAPSGDNSQPWKFVITKNYDINLFNLPDKDNPILNVHQGGSLISHGAVITNITIAACKLGYKTNVLYFPDNNNSDLIAKISFLENLDKYEECDSYLIDSIYERRTNRRHYNKYLSDDLVNKIFKNLKDKDIEIKIFKENREKEIIAQAISISEEVILKTKELHELLFKDVMWTKKQELSEKHGLYINTLEFNPVQKLVFWICRKWNNIYFLNKTFNFAHFVGSQNSDIYKSSGLLGFIILPNSDLINYIKAGELFQLIWLRSTHFSLSFQPVTGLFFLNERIKIFGNEPISSENSMRIKNQYNKLCNLIKINNDQIILTSFRIGKSKKSSALSSRLDPNIILE